MSEVKLIQGDCLKVMQDLIADGVKVDLIVTDPPYGITDNKWDNIISFELMWECIKQIRSDKKTPILFFASQPFTSKLVMSNLKWFKYEWIYQKASGSNFGVVKYQPRKDHEEILVFGEKSPYYYPIMEERKGSGLSRVQYGKIKFGDKVSDNYGNMKHQAFEKFYGDLRYPSSVQYFNNRGKGSRGLHPNQKPVELLEYLIKTYSNENDTVLDFTMGSGSTGVACLQTNRNFIGIELEPKYYEIAEQRINEAKAQRRLI